MMQPQETGGVGPAVSGLTSALQQHLAQNAASARRKIPFDQAMQNAITMLG